MDKPLDLTVSCVRLHMCYVSAVSEERTPNDVLRSLAHLVVALYLMALANDVADYRGFLLPPDAAILPDVAHSVLPLVHAGAQFSDLMTLLMYFAAIAIVSTKVEACALLCEYFDLHAPLALLRSVMVPLTTLPSPVPGCRDRGERVSLSLLGPLTRVLMPTILTSWCHDLIYSGHTVVYTLTLLFVYDLNVHLALPIIIWTCAVAGCIALLSARVHYAVDGALSIAFTTLMYGRRRLHIQRQAQLQAQKLLSI